MKRQLALPALAAALLLAACTAPSGPNYRIKGQFSDMNSGEIYIYADGVSDARFDTIRVKDGKFIYAGQTNDLIALHIFFPNALEQVVFVGPGQQLTYEAKANDLGNFRAKGNPENELMNKFREETSRKDSATVRRVARRYIQEHSTSPVAVHLFDRYFLQSASAPAAERDSLLALLRQGQPNERLLLAAEGRLRQRSKALVGDTLPDIRIPLWQGDTLSLAPPTPRLLIVFWATWMDRSWEFLRDLRTIHQDHHESDSLEVLAISLDTQIYEWEDHIKPDSTTLLHACDGHAWDSPLVAPFGISQLPTYFLCTPEGTIRLRTTRQDNMARNVEQFIKDTQTD